MQRGANSQIGSLLPGSFASPKTFSCLISLDHEVLAAGIVAQHTRLIMQIKTCFAVKIDGEMARLRVCSVRKSATIQSGFGAIIFICSKASYLGYCGCYRHDVGIQGNGAAGCPWHGMAECWEKGSALLRTAGAQASPSPPAPPCAPTTTTASFLFCFKVAERIKCPS